MNARTNAKQVQAYFLIDHTGEMVRHLEFIQKQLNNHINRMRRDYNIYSRVHLKTIIMNAATCQTFETINHWFQFTSNQIGCDLGQALQMVEHSLGDVSEESKVELFVLLKNEPAGDWKAKIKSLKADQRVRITILAFGDETEVQTETLQEMRTWPRGAVRSMLKQKNITELFDWIFELLKGAVKEMENSAHTPTQTARTQPSQQATVPPRQQGTVTPVIDLGSPPASSTPAQVVPPPVKPGGVAAIWKEVEPPQELGDRVAHTDVRALPTSGNWRMIGASLRGKMHAHKGIFREDAFALGEAEDWHLMVVADGGGSCPLSRVGSQLAADTAVETMAQLIRSLNQTDWPIEQIAQFVLEEGLQDAWKALESEAEKRGVPLGHLGTTFLAVIHRPLENGCLVGVTQVGDGLVAAQLANGPIVYLAEPDVGQTAGVTFFLTSKPWQEWLERVNVCHLETPLQMLTAMCDGVADDFIPFRQHFPKLLIELQKIVEKEKPEQALLEWLGYEKRGSFDDRTLTLLYEAQGMLEQAVPQQPEKEPVKVTQETPPDTLEEPLIVKESEPPAEETPAQESVTATEQADSQQSEPPAEETPAQENVIATEQVDSQQSEPPAEETPAQESVTEQADSQQSQPPAEETPAQESVTEQADSRQSEPPAEETPAQESITATEQADSQQSEPPAEETPAKESVIATEQADSQQSESPAEEHSTTKETSASLDGHPRDAH